MKRIWLKSQLKYHFTSNHLLGFEAAASALTLGSAHLPFSTKLFLVASLIISAPVFALDEITDMQDSILLELPLNVPSLYTAVCSENI